MSHKKLRKFTYRSTDAYGKPVPSLAVEGKFLSQFGFSIGSMVNVEYGNGFVHISQVLRKQYGGDSPEAFAPVRR